MVSLNFLAFAAALLAATAMSKPIVASSSDSDIQAAPPNYCKDVSITDEYKNLVRITHRFNKEEKDESDTSEVQKFSSPVKLDKDTYVNYVPGKGAVLVKSDWQGTPTRMRFLYVYPDQNDREEAVYIIVDIKEQCTVKGSEQWPNLKEVAYFTMPIVEN